MPSASDFIDSTDFLVIGSGIAGLRAALGLVTAGRVLILTKAEPTDSNTGQAQGGIAAALGDDDSPELHAADTLRAGDGLCDEAAVSVLVHEGPGYVRQLMDWGARFDHEASGRLAFGREAAHSVRRVLHAGDATGREIGRALWTRAVGQRAIRTINHALVTALLVDGDRVVGARYFDADGRARLVHAGATLLATGGAGQVYRETTNPAIATGDGIALAFRAGAWVADVEFVQFHPTAFNGAGAPRFLLSEALRGEGARLANARGDPFMLRYHPGGDLAPRDVVARSIVRESEQSGGVFLTLSHLDATYVRGRFPWIAEMCRQYGYNLATDRVPVTPAAHYMMGGVDTDTWARTSLPGLFAAGEVACTGVHGANRLASNSLLEGLVFGARAGEAMQQPPRAADPTPDRRDSGDRVLPAADDGEAAATAMAGAASDRIRDVMWRKAGLFRTAEGLGEAVQELRREYAAASRRVGASPSDVDAWRDTNLATVATLVAHAALRRQESRGGHCRLDFPKRDDPAWRTHLRDRSPRPGQQIE